MRLTIWIDSLNILISWTSLLYTSILKCALSMFEVFFLMERGRILFDLVGNDKEIVTYGEGERGS